MAAARVDRRLAAILAADVVGYSRLLERDTALPPSSAEFRAQILTAGKSAASKTSSHGLPYTPKEAAR